LTETGFLGDVTLRPVTGRNADQNADHARLGLIMTPWRLTEKRPEVTRRRGRAQERLEPMWRVASRPAGAVSLKPRASWRSNWGQVRKPSIESVADPSNREVANGPW
jgi:hypothetical protein